MPCTTCTPGRPRHTARKSRTMPPSRVRTFSLSSSRSLLQPHHALKSPGADDHREGPTSEELVSARAPLLLTRKNEEEGRRRRNSGNRFTWRAEYPDFHGSLTACGNRDRRFSRRTTIWFWPLDFDCPVHTREARLDSLDLPRRERFLARFSCVRHLELRSRHQARRPRETSNLNIATCFLRRSRKI